MNETAARPDRTRWLVPLVAGLALSAAHFWPLLFEGRSLYADDIRHYHVPMLEAWWAAISNGRLPLWTDHSYLGFPLIADPQVATFYPGTWLVAALGPVAGYAWLTWLHLLIASAGTFRLARSFDATLLASGVAAALLAQCGFFANEIQHPGLLAILCWMPWWWWITHRAMQGGRLRDVVVLALVVALMLFAGTLQVLLGGLILYAFFFLGLVARALDRETRAVALRGIGMVGAGNLLGLALAAIVIAPAVAHLPLTARALGMTYDFAAMGSLHPVDLLGVSLDGAAAARVAAGGEPLEFANLSFYLGAFTLPLALLGWVSLERRFAVCFGLGFALLVAIGMGRHAPVHPWLFETWPSVFEGFRGMSRALGPLSIALALLAGLGLDRMIERFAANRVRWLGAASIWALLLAITVVALGVPDGAGPWSSVVVVFLCVGTLASLPPTRAAWILAAFLLVDLAWASPIRQVLRTHPTSEAADPASDALPSLHTHLAGNDTRIMLHGFGPLNLPLRNGVDGVGGYNPLVTLAYLDFVNRVNQRRHFPREPLSEFVSGAKPQRFQSPLFAAAAISHVASNRHDRVRGLVPTDPRGNEAFEPMGARIYRYPDPLPRAYVAYRTLRATDLAELDRLLGRRDFDPRATSVVEGAGPTLEGAASIRRVERGGTWPERRRFAFEHATPGVLVVADADYPGWRATVNGSAAPIFRVNGMFRGVSVPAGAVEVEMEFAPASFAFGAAVSALALVVLIALGAVAARSPARAGGAT